VTAPIRSVRTRILATDLDDPVVTPNYRIEQIHNVLVELEDDEGLVGAGYLWCFDRTDADVLAAMVAALAPVVMRATTSDPQDVSEQVRRHINFLGFKGVAVFALSAVDLAVTDLACRRAGISLTRAIGQTPAPAPTYWSGLFLTSSTSELVREVERAVRSGFTAVKLRVGMPDLDDDVQRIEAVRSALPPDALLMLDAVQRWDLDDAIVAADAFAPYDIVWLEDPLVHTDYAGLRTLVAQSPVPIATGENEYLREGFEQLFDAEVPILLADLQRVGGVTEWSAVAERAAASGVQLTSHAYPQVSARLCAGSPTATWVEYVPWWDHLVDYELTIENGRITAPDDAGIGLTWNRDAVEHDAVTDWIAHGIRGEDSSSSFV